MSPFPRRTHNAIISGLFLLTPLLVVHSVSHAQDWANLSYYEAANAEIASTKNGEQRIVFMGDSITQAWSNRYPDFFDGAPYVNRGISGQTSAQMVIRFRQDVIELKPAVVVILAGTNDIAENKGPTTLEAIANNIKSMAELARMNDIEPIIVSVLPAFDYPWSPGLSPNTKIPLLNAMLQDYANGNGFYFLDCYSEMVDDRNGLRDELTSDGVHLTRQGYEVLSGLVSRAVRSLRDK